MTLTTSDPAPALLSGVWLPIVTPFRDGVVDLESYERLLHHYLDTGLSGILPLGTTGEGPTLEQEEMEAILETTVKVIGGRLPIYVGVSGSGTQKVIRTLRFLERYAFAGILSVCPYYNRPSEAGIVEHFRRIADATDRKVVL